MSYYIMYQLQFWALGIPVQKKTQPLVLERITLPSWIMWYHKPPVFLVAPCNFICYLFFPYLLSKC